MPTAALPPAPHAPALGPGTGVGIPAPAPHEVRRERLLEVLHSHAGRPLLLLAAPAGFGKSTLAAAYARDSGAAVAWLTLGAADRDSRTFFTHLARAFEAAFGSDHAVPELRAGLLHAAEGVGLARLLLLDLANAPEGFLLVLDDFHVVHDTDEVVESVEALLRGLPEDGGQLVITARDVPPLQLARLVASDAVFALGAEDLRFTPDEVAALRQALGGPAELDVQSDGWVAGILLGGAPRQLGAMGGTMLGAYVEREVLGRLKPTEQRWLETLAVVDAITPAAAERLLGAGPWALRLGTLRERCPFLVAGANGGGYRLHGLVREALLGRLRRRGPARALRAWAAARDLALGANDLEGIVRACQELGRDQEAVAHVRRTVDEALRTGRWTAALSNLQLLAEPVRRADPDLSLAEAHALMQSGRPEPAQTIAEGVLHHAGRTGDVALQLRALVEVLAISSYRGDHQGVDDWYAAADHLLKEARLPDAERRLLEGRARGIRGISFAVRGDLLRAADALHDAIRTLAPLGPSRDLANAQNNLGKLNTHAGDFAAASEVTLAAITTWRRLGDRVRLAMSQTVLGDIYFRTGQLEAAGAAYTAARDTARMVGAQRVEAFATLSLGAWHHASGRLQEAAHHCDAALQFAEQVSDRELLAGALRRRAEAAIALGDLSTAVSLLGRAQAEAEALRSAYHIACVDRALGRLHLADGALEYALTHFRRSLERGAGAWGSDDAAPTLYWLGCAHLLLGRASQAQDALRDALDRAEAAGGLAVLAPAAAEDPRLLEHGETAGREPVRLPALRALVEARRSWRSTPHAPPALGLVARNELPRLEVRLLGGLEVYRDGELLVPSRQLPADRGRQLLALLVLRPAGLTGRELADQLFGGMPPNKAQHNLRMALYLLRQQLGSRAAVRHQSGTYQLPPRLDLQADTRAFDVALSRASRATNDLDAVSALRQAVDLYRGPLLADLPWIWAEPLRDAYQTRFIQAALRLAGLLAERDPSSADLLAERVLSLEPENSRAYERLLANARARGSEIAVRRLIDRSRRVPAPGVWISGAAGASPP